MLVVSVSRHFLLRRGTHDHLCKLALSSLSFLYATMTMLLAVANA